MSDPQAALRASWKAVVSDLLAQSEQPNSDVPNFSHSQRLNLQLVEPIMIGDGYALIAAPHENAKTVIETELGEYITRALSQHMGRPCSLAVTIAAPPQPAPQEEPPAPAPQRPIQTEAPEHGMGHQTQAFQQPTQSTQPAPASQPETPNHHQPRSWEAAHSPASLDELAQHYSEQQSTAPSGYPEATGARIPREEPAHNPNREKSLNPKHTFENFVIGSSNRFANGAAVAVAENPARAYNPLFIWGGSGLGKTHLLHAAGNYAQVLHPGLRVKYVSSEEFTNDYINSLRDDRQESFKRRYRNLDILMVDDIQFLEGKESTQEEFFHTFNALHQANKQIILSSDRPPKQLTTLEDRLRTRFEGGLITDIQPPDLETRIAILMKKASADGTDVDRSVLELIASRFESSIRELEGALIRVSAYSSLVNEPISLEMAEIALHDLAPDSADRQITAAAIIEVTADYFNIDVDTLRGSGKKRAVAHARQLAMYLCRELTELSLPKIGDQFGGKDHTTVIYADRKIRKEMTENRNTYDEIQALTQRVKNHNQR
ncbi:chromosomal replication initiation protein DnaA [Corynebacterium sp. HMSC074C01]|uniref:Chromosomal replication initiator protein DnaA n=1 Tax=Corynebacterium aurimucosum (strain ATCC 700975 / DSM 44827 / CIP 107346 / CN-1) TaxID=548476 RepID=DNAA_CORA7|nr:MULTISPECIES: chromosomal replication initiator protein DnaA [Corynebacterium]C3PE72.1 RecName: Full=Chromosomal replication initiator protein DnaA [Corynebacterium aurimucosum ATCC 700975]ACP31600.1 chromosomal replication initiator protein [Corynebacterium aurimucosum ATCC 700975]OFP63732.1 chromosomal replication initiation protein DnaA [Corynebacterium sp. HMSC074C01]QQU94167.1 chromosomal replication initiator protein DnaA [Corynebacterium aurimucosum]